MGTGTRPVDRPAVPVRLIVSGAAGLESPTRDLVAIEPRGAEQAVRGVQLIPLGIAVHRRQQTALSAPKEESALFEGQAVAGHVLGPKLDRPADRLFP